MSQISNYRTFQEQPSKIEDNKSPKTSHYFWKICAWLSTCCISSHAMASEKPLLPQELLERALQNAGHQLKVVDSYPQGRDYLLETIKTGERIDIISPHHADESLKSVEELSNEINQKVAQHFGFKDRMERFPDRYLMTRDGCKIDLGEHLKVTSGPVDEKFLKYSDQVIQYSGKDFDFNRVHSYTVIQTTLQDRIRMHDDYDEIRTDGKKGFFINIDKTQPDYMTIVRQ